MKNLLVTCMLLSAVQSSPTDINTVENTFQKNIFIKGQSFISLFGKRKKIILPDQTEVVLNSNTTLWLDKNFGKQNRKVQIAGDALFLVKKNNTPFIIYTPHLIITTAKAIAKVNAYADIAGEETLVLSGKLHVVKSYYSKLDHEPYELKDGEMIMMNRDIDLMEKETFDTSDLKTWMEDKFVVQDISLNELINKLKNWYNMDIEISGNVADNLRYTGTFHHADLQDILAAIGKAWKFRYQGQRNPVILKF